MKSVISNTWLELTHVDICPYIKPKKCPASLNWEIFLVRRNAALLSFTTANKKKKLKTWASESLTTFLILSKSTELSRIIKKFQAPFKIFGLVKNMVSRAWHFLNLLNDEKSPDWKPLSATTSLTPRTQASPVKMLLLKARGRDWWINHIRNVKIHNEQAAGSSLTFIKRRRFSCPALQPGHLHLPACYLDLSDHFSAFRILHIVTLRNPQRWSNDFSSQHSVTQTVTYLNIKPPIWGTGLWRQTANLATPRTRSWFWN